MTKASDLFVTCLEEEGVEYVFGVPGEENLDFLDSLVRSKKIKLILTRHEQGAGFMAATYGATPARRASASPPWARARPTSSPPPPTPSWAACR
jgi:thiamine pyrophosphate-dependent acetolactate synthase large subunit-like protein